MHQLPNCCAKRPHVDLERIVQTTVGKAKRTISFRGTDLDKKDKGTGVLTSVFLVPRNRALSKTVTVVMSHYGTYLPVGYTHVI